MTVADMKRERVPEGGGFYLEGMVAIELSWGFRDLQTMLTIADGRERGGLYL